MGLTKFDELNTAQCCVYLGATLPTHPADYYGVARNDVDSVEWKGGEMAFLNASASNAGKLKLYIQTATSGTTATWKRRQDVFVAV